MATLTPTKAPNLATAPQQYMQSEQNKFSNQLRLYFNQIDSNTQQSAVAINSAATLSWLGDL